MNSTWLLLLPQFMFLLHNTIGHASTYTLWTTHCEYTLCITQPFCYFGSEKLFSNCGSCISVYLANILSVTRQEKVYILYLFFVWYTTYIQRICWIKKLNVKLVCFWQVVLYTSSLPLTLHQTGFSTNLSQAGPKWAQHHHSKKWHQKDTTLRLLSSQICNLLELIDE